MKKNKHISNPAGAMCPKCRHTQSGYPFTNCEKCKFWRVCRADELDLAIWNLPEKERRKVCGQGPLAMRHFRQGT